MSWSSLGSKSKTKDPKFQPDNYCAFCGAWTLFLTENKQSHGVEEIGTLLQNAHGWMKNERDVLIYIRSICCVLGSLPQ